MLKPRSANDSRDCIAIVEALSGDYPLCLGWQACLEPLLPPLHEAVELDGRGYRRCIAFLVDEDLGPHFVFDGEGGYSEVLVSEVGFTEPLSDEAQLWLRAFSEWRDRRSGRRAPLRLV
jgi:hypothetical protein